MAENLTGKTEITDMELMAKAKEAMAQAYAPYSRFQVGAALLADNGQIFLGCNVENASYGGTICAERAAVVKAVSEGVRTFRKIAIAASSGEYASPGGICRQVLYEFMPDGVVLLDSEKEGMKSFSVRELLPFGFGPEDLR